VLVNNAGVLMASRLLAKKSGIEMGVVTNHLGPFLLTKLLMPTLLRHGQPRVVTVGSSLHHLPRGLDFRRMKAREGFRSADMFEVYSETKLCNMIFTRELHRRYGDRGLLAVCVHPGTVMTEVHRNLNWIVLALWTVSTPLLRLIMKSPSMGSESSVFAATSTTLKGWAGGAYLVHCRSAQYNLLADDAPLGQKLWEWSMTLTDM
jgi:retinol dehydrogenase-12